MPRTVKAPQGYLGLDYQAPESDPLHWGGTQTGFYNFDFPVEIRSTAAAMAGTFWAFDFSFRGSEAGLPANHANKDSQSQGGYLGLQIDESGAGLAIFSIFWATDAEAAPAPGYIEEDVEAWYVDREPVEWIHDMATIDPARRFAGGPFKSCRLKVDIAADTPYRLRIWELSDARKPDEPEWWGAWLINDGPDGGEQFIGKLQVPGNWGWLNRNPGGFMEHWTAMTDCHDIPASTTTYRSATGDNGSVELPVSCRLYGDCAADLTLATSRDGDATVATIAHSVAEAAEEASSDVAQAVEAATDDVADAVERMTDGITNLFG